MTCKQRQEKLILLNVSNVKKPRYEKYASSIQTFQHSILQLMQHKYDKIILEEQKQEAKVKKIIQKAKEFDIFKTKVLYELMNIRINNGFKLYI